MNASLIAPRNPTPSGATASGFNPSVRAEYPPPHYWRRWSGDAPAGVPAAAHPAASHPAASLAPSDGDTGNAELALGEAPYRVLVVEDDASQALFAESVLKGAGIQAQVASEHTQVMTAMEQFHPDLVLMDLHLPGCSGIELTASIRAHPSFLHTPVVFLTGDQDPDRQFEVLESGADDFLSKPIKPRHLIAAVQSRIKRARAMQRQRFDGASRHPVTGLHTRPYLLQRIAAAIGAGSAGAGALFVEIQNATPLRERYGYAGFEQLMLDAGKRIGELAGACPGARLNDNAFLVFAPEGAQSLEVLTRRLRDGIRTSSFDMAGMPQHLGTAIGYSMLDHDFADAGSVLDAVEQAARAARAEPTSLSQWQPTQRGADPAGSLADAMRAGLRDEAFELRFQPIVAVAGGNEAQFQVLLRMHDDDGVVHNAGELVPVAENIGLMPDIDRWVLQQAIDLLHRKRSERSLRLFVSQSPLTLARDLHGAWLQEMLESHGIDGPSLVIDLRLDDALVHSITLRRFCEQLMPVGVQFCLSQYAHGNEADALLQQLPLGYVRLSPRYSHAHSDTPLRDELRGAIDRAHRLGLQVIGPQVEDAQGAATLWMSGIDFIQGNLVQPALGELDFDFQHSVL
jgi:EAL domain-containing protein (putative c-di-GMP-specific phosphodiesterase class I)/PleD family two-component response regulator